MSNATLGIDVGKYELALALRKGEKFTDKLVENNFKGHQKILKFLENKAPKAEVYLEATGRYGKEVTDFLSSREFDLYHFQFARTYWMASKTDLNFCCKAPNFLF